MRWTRDNFLCTDFRALKHQKSEVCIVLVEKNCKIAGEFIGETPLFSKKNGNENPFKNLWISFSTFRNSQILSNSIYRKIHNCEFEFLNKKQWFWEYFECQVCHDNLNFRAKIRDFAKVKIQRKLKNSEFWQFLARKFKI